MPDPVRVTRAVRRCDLCGGTGYFTGMNDPSATTPCRDCSDGWVDVPVDEECPECDGEGSYLIGPYMDQRRVDCSYCGGSGRRLHNWATGWCVGDEALTYWIEADTLFHAPIVVRTLSVGGECYAENNWEYEGPVTDLALVLSDPGHRPEPMRWENP